MKTKVISFLNKKGGVGKTTLAVNTAAFLSLNYKVAIIDTDKQDSTYDWLNQIKKENLSLFSIRRPSQIDKHLDEIKKNNDIIIFDCAPEMTMMTSNVIESTDIMIIPITVSELDLWASYNMIKKIKQKSHLSFGKLKLFFQINRAKTNTKLINDVREACGDYEIEVFKTIIYDRVIVAECPTLQKTLADINPKNQAYIEMQSFINEIEEHI